MVGITQIALSFTITQQDLVKGRADDCTCCPMALAINRALEQAGYPEYASEVYPEAAYLRTTNHELAEFEASIPAELRGFIFEFDNWPDTDQFGYPTDLADFRWGIKAPHIRSDEDMVYQVPFKGSLRFSRIAEPAEVA